MDRLAAGIVIALTILVMHGGPVRDVRAEEGVRSLSTLSSATPVVSGVRSARVLSLLLTLEALRAAPQVLDAPPGGC